VIYDEALRDRALSRSERDAMAIVLLERRVSAPTLGGGPQPAVSVRLDRYSIPENFRERLIAKDHSSSATAPGNAICISLSRIGLLSTYCPVSDR
jgi:hypothetical protein